MEFPHHHHHRRDEEDEAYPPRGQPFPPPPPPFYGENEQFPPPPQVTQVYHSSHGRPGEPYAPPPAFTSEYDRPPPPQVTQVYHSAHVQSGEPYAPPPPFSSAYDRPPPPPSQGFDSYSGSGYSPYPPPEATVQHVSHESESDRHHFRPHMPSFIQNITHHQGSESPSRKPTVRVYCKAKTDFSLTSRDGKVILARSDPSDPYQHWIKDERLSTKVKDEQGFPSFALVNKATGEAIKHSIGATHPVRLIPYNPDVLDESILWTESKDLGDGYRAVRMVNNIRLNLDAFNGDKEHGGVHDGTTIVLWEWKKGDNQRWTTVPY